MQLRAILGAFGLAVLRASSSALTLILFFREIALASRFSSHCLPCNARPWRTAPVRKFAYHLTEGCDLDRVSGGVQLILSDLPDDRCEFCRIRIAFGTPGRAEVAAVLRNMPFQVAEPEDRADIKVDTALLAESRQRGRVMKTLLGSST